MEATSKGSRWSPRLFTLGGENNKLEISGRIRHSHGQLGEKKKNQPNYKALGGKHTQTGLKECSEGMGKNVCGET